MFSYIRLEKSTAYYAINSMYENTSSEADRSSTSQEISLHSHVHKSPPLDPIVSQMYPAHTFTPYFLMIHLNSKM